MYHVYRKHPDGRGHVYHLGSYETAAELFRNHKLGDLSSDPNVRRTVWRASPLGFKVPDFTYPPYVETDNGVILSEETLLGLYRKVRPIFHYFWGWKRAHGHYYRHPRTTQERRMAAGVEKEDGEPDFRGPRRIHTLPSVYDDRPVSSRRNNNWKRYRKHQWK